MALAADVPRWAKAATRCTGTRMTAAMVNTVRGRDLITAKAPSSRSDSVIGRSGTGSRGGALRGVGEVGSSESTRSSRGTGRPGAGSPPPSWPCDVLSGAAQPCCSTNVVPSVPIRADGAGDERPLLPVRPPHLRQPDPARPRSGSVGRLSAWTASGHRPTATASPRCTTTGTPTSPTPRPASSCSPSWPAPPRPPATAGPSACSSSGSAPAGWRCPWRPAGCRSPASTRPPRCWPGWRPSPAPIGSTLVVGDMADLDEVLPPAGPEPGSVAFALAFAAYNTLFNLPTGEAQRGVRPGRGRSPGAGRTARDRGLRAGRRPDGEARRRGRQPHRRHRAGAHRHRARPRPPDHHRSARADHRGRRPAATVAGALPAARTSSTRSPPRPASSSSTGGPTGGGRRSMTPARCTCRSTVERREPTPPQPAQRPLGHRRHRAGHPPGGLRPTPVAGRDRPEPAVPVLPRQRGGHAARARDLRPRRVVARAGRAQPLSRLLRRRRDGGHPHRAGVRAGAGQRHPRGAGADPQARHRMGRARRHGRRSGHGRDP